jgi:3-polyprenyl-4-hydroxybenzoate decarboxylase
MAELAGDGVTIMPLSPGWYGSPATIDDLVADFVSRVLQVVGLGRAEGWKAGELAEGHPKLSA